MTFTRQLVTVDAEISVLGPLLVQSSEPGPWGVDAVCLRDTTDRLVIPGTELMGLYRAALDRLGCDSFGRAASSATSNSESGRSLKQDKSATGLMAEPLSSFSVDPGNISSRYPVWFSDARSVHVWPVAGQHTTSMTAVDPESGTAKPMSLRALDCPVPIGAQAAFRFQVVAAVPDGLHKNFAEVLNAVLQEGLQYAGGHRTIGFGEVRESVIMGLRYYQPATFATTDARTQVFSNLALESASASLFPLGSSHVASENAKAWAASCPAAFTVEWQVLDPFCLTEGVVNGNVYESVSFLRGDVLRGALAGLLKRALGIDSRTNMGHGSDLRQMQQPVCKNFDAIGFTDAHLSGNCIAPRSFAVHRGRMFDLSLISQPDGSACLLDGIAPRFQPDWKESEWRIVRSVFPQREPRRELRIRTQIHAGTRRSDDEKLFAQRLVDPTDQLWQGRMTLHADGLTAANALSTPKEREDLFRSVFLQLEDMLNSGHMTVGKTKARIRGRIIGHQPFESFDEVAKDVETSVDAGESFVVMLTSASMLVDYYKHPELTLDPKRLTDIYREVFTELSNGVCTLQRCFVSHQLVGGFRAWQETSATGKPYNPLLFTSPGSVFVLKAEKSRKADAGRCVSRWLSRGLTPPGKNVLTWVGERFGDEFPFIILPQNGYGGIKLISDQCKQYRPGTETLNVVEGVIQ